MWVADSCRSFWSVGTVFGHSFATLHEPDFGLSATSSLAMRSTVAHSNRTLLRLIRSCTSSARPIRVPRKLPNFGALILVSIQEAVPAAVAAGVRHFVYVSVAHPAPVMEAYIAVRSEGEALLRARRD